MAMYKVTMEAVEHQEWTAYVEADSLEETKEKVKAGDFDFCEDELIEQRYNPFDVAYTEEFELQGARIELDEDQE